MTNPVLLIIIAAVVLLGPAVILRLPDDPLRWRHRGGPDTDPEPGELPELLRRPPRPRPRPN